MSSPQPEAIDKTSNTKVPFSEIHVTLTFADYEPMLFKFRRKLNEEEKAEKQHFLNLSPEDKKEVENDYRSKTLASLLIEAPVGVPDYDEEKEDGAEPASVKFRRFFSNPDNQEILDWVYASYTNKLYPKEFFSTLSKS